MKVLFKINCLFTIVLFSTSCATLLSKKEPLKTLTSEPSGATVKDENGNTLGKTPLNLSALPKTNSTLVITQEGFITDKVYLSRGDKNGFAFLDALFLCIPCIVDVPNNALEYIDLPEKVNVSLKKVLPERERTVAFELVNLEYNLAGTENLGEFLGQKVTLNNSDLKRKIGFNSSATTDIQELFENFNSKVRYENEDFTEKVAKKSRFMIIRPELKTFDIAVALNGSNKQQGQVAGSIIWNVYAPGNTTKPVASFNINNALFYQQVMYSNNTKPFKAFLMDNAYRLLSNDSFYNVITKTYSDEKELPKGEKIAIASPKNVKLETTKEIIKHATSSVVTIYDKGETKFGSGFFISQDGYIITNEHVIDEMDVIMVKLSNNITMKAKLVKVDADFDVALLKVELEDLPALKLALNEKPDVGDELWAIGTPLEIGLNQTVTKGIVSGLRIDEDKKHRYIQTDVAVNPGNSGGPMINTKGEVIGVTVKMNRFGQGIAYGIPIDLVIEKLNIELK